VSTSTKYFDPDEIDFWFGDSDSAGGNCPAVCRVPGGAIVQGKKLDAATQAAVARATGERGYGTGPDEDAVFVPQNVIDQIRGGGLG